MDEFVSPDQGQASERVRVSKDCNLATAFQTYDALFVGRTPNGRLAVSNSQAEISDLLGTIITPLTRRSPPLMYGQPGDGPEMVRLLRPGSSFPAGAGEDRIIHISGNEDETKVILPLAFIERAGIPHSERVPRVEFTTSGDTIDMPQGTRATLGRASDRSIGIDPAKTTVSNRHAQVHVSAYGVFIRDGGSRSGTFVTHNGSESQIDGKEPLATGDRIRIGSETQGAQFIVRRTDTGIRLEYLDP